MQESFYDFTAESSDGKTVQMEDYKGRVVLVVNTASKCIYTSQYEGLQKLYEKYADKGLSILCFPCDQFAHQEPGTDEEIKQFCSINYGVTFPLFKKINVNGKKAPPLYRYLRHALPERFGSNIKWNFTKFLIDKNGNPFKRYGTKTTPEEMEDDIKALLNEP